MKYDEYCDYHAERRDKKRDRNHRMVVSNRSMKTVILPMIGKRASEARRKGGQNAR